MPANAATLRSWQSRSRSANYTVPKPLPELQLTIPLELAGLRLDQALARLLPEESRSRLARLIDEGTCGRRARPPSAKAQGEERRGGRGRPRAARRRRPPSRPRRSRSPIVHEDDDLLVIDKPAGLVVHPGSGNWAGTLLNALLHHAPALRRCRAPASCTASTRTRAACSWWRRPSPRRPRSCASCRRARVKRTYLALARGKVAGAGQGRCAHRPPSRAAHAHGGGAGRQARDHPLPRARALPDAHAARVPARDRPHAPDPRAPASIGHPLEGDPVYAGRGPRSFPRQALHAWKLAFMHPRAARRCSFESPLPADFDALLGEPAPDEPAARAGSCPTGLRRARVRAFVTTRARRREHRASTRA